MLRSTRLSLPGANVFFVVAMGLVLVNMSKANTLHPSKSTPSASIVLPSMGGSTTSTIAELELRLERLENRNTVGGDRRNMYHRSHSQTNSEQQAEFMGYINVMSSPFNASGSGIVDDTASFQTALQYAGSLGGGIVYAPTGNYLISQSLYVPAGVTLMGVALYPFRSWGTLSPNVKYGTTLMVVADAGNSTAPPFLMMNTNSGVVGLSIFYPNQTETNPPVTYPYAVGGTGDDITVKNVLLVNPFLGIDFASHECARHYVEGVYGQPLSIGIAVDQTYDIGRIKHVHFWPFWSSNPNVLSYQHDNGVTFLFMRSDWEIVEDVFSWGYAVGMRFTSSQYGALNGQFTDINFDDVGIGIDINCTQPWGLMFSNLNVANAGDGKNHIGVYGRYNPACLDVSVVIRGASFWGDILSSLVWDNTGYIQLSNSLLQSYNITHPSVQISQGRVNLNSNQFLSANGANSTAILIQPTVKQVLVTGNMFNNGTVDNRAPAANVIISNNFT